MKKLQKLSEEEIEENLLKGKFNIKRQRELHKCLDQQIEALRSIKKLEIKTRRMLDRLQVEFDKTFDTKDCQNE